MPGTTTPRRNLGQLVAVRPTVEPVPIAPAGPDGRIANLKLADTVSAKAEVAALGLHPDDFSTAFTELTATDPARAQRFAGAYVASLEGADRIRSFSDLLSQAPREDRLVVLAAGKDSGAADTIVSGVALLPEAQAKV